jgi:hypothetical protein
MGFLGGPGSGEGQITSAAWLPTSAPTQSILAAVDRWLTLSEHTCGSIHLIANACEHELAHSNSHQTRAI